MKKFIEKVVGGSEITFTVVPHINFTISSRDKFHSSLFTFKILKNIIYL